MALVHEQVPVGVHVVVVELNDGLADEQDVVCDGAVDELGKVLVGQFVLREVDDVLGLHGGRGAGRQLRLVVHEGEIRVLANDEELLILVHQSAVDQPLAELLEEHQLNGVLDAEKYVCGSLKLAVDLIIDS